MRRLSSYVARYGPEVGPRLLHVLQSQAAHAGVGARRRRKLLALRAARSAALPLFDPPAAADPDPAVAEPPTSLTVDEPGR